MKLASTQQSYQYVVWQYVDMTVTDETDDASSCGTLSFGCHLKILLSVAFVTDWLQLVPQHAVHCSPYRLQRCACLLPVLTLILRVCPLIRLY